MKFFFLIIVCFLLLVSCNHKYSSNPEILHAEELLNSHPDSSFKILSAIKQPEKMKEVDYAAWCLNFTYALNKLHKHNLSDSSINFSIQYYEKRKDNKHAGTAYYLAGYMYRLRNKNKEAIIALKKAEKLLEATNEMRIKGLVQFNLGYIYMNDQLYVHSLKYFQKSLSNFKLSGDLKSAAYSYREISDMYVQLNYPFDSIMAYSNKALALSKQGGDSINYYSILSRQGELLYKTDYYRSKEYILCGYRHLRSNYPYYASFLAYMYMKLNKPDSAQYYLKISLADTTKSTHKITNYLVGAYIARNEGDYKKAFSRIEIAYIQRDSIDQKSLQSQLYRIDKQYDLSESENQKAELTIANQTQLIWIILLVTGIVIAFFVIMFIIDWNKKEKIIQNSKMQTLEFEKQSEKNNNEQKKEIIQMNLKNKIGNTLNIHKLKKGFTTKEAFVQEITEQSILTKNDWKIYIKDVNKLVDNGISRLKEEHADLSETDQMVIALICLKVDINDSCNLLGMIKKTMYTRRKTIKKRLNLDAETDLEKWITQNLLKEE